MNTIFIPVYPQPSGRNVTQLDVDFNEFDPHQGVRFSVVLKNPEGLTLDRTYTNLAGEDWQDWPPEQTAAADYNYVKKIVLRNLGYTEAISPFITSQPVSQKVLQGDPVSFSVEASGDSPLSYQWRKNGLPISGAESTSYAISSSSSTNLGQYDVLVTNPVGSVLSSSVSLSFYAAPVISSQPSNLNLTTGQNGFLTLGVNGDSPFTYQWSKDGVDITDATGLNYEITNAEVDDSGEYSVKVSNIAGSVVSDPALVTVTEPAPPPPPVPTGENP